MRLSACGCRPEHYGRVERAWWMKAIWMRRLYHCYSCDEVLFISPGRVAERTEQLRRLERHKARTAKAPAVKESAGRRTSRQEKPA